MDRRVKERLIGASILAVLVVLIVPELLSGPAPRAPSAEAPSVAQPTRNVTVELGSGASAPAPSTQPAAADAQPTGTPVAHAPSVVTMPAAMPPPSPAPPMRAATTVEKPVSAPMTPSASARSGHGWSVQIGVFASRPNADKLVRELKARGFSVYVAPLGANARARYRVRSGPFSDRTAATQVMLKLQSAGQKATLTPPGT